MRTATDEWGRELEYSNNNSMTYVWYHQINSMTKQLNKY